MLNLTKLCSEELRRYHCCPWTHRAYVGLSSASSLRHWQTIYSYSRHVGWAVKASSFCDYSTQVPEIRTQAQASRMRALLKGSGFLEVGATLRRSKLYTGSYKRCFLAACRGVYVASMAAQRGCKLEGKERTCKVFLCLPVRGPCFSGHPCKTSRFRNGCLVPKVMCKHPGHKQSMAYPNITLNPNIPVVSIFFSIIPI